MSVPKRKCEGLDLAGVGKLAEAIPEEVYTRSAETVLITFEKLVAPITETASGFGRYIRQKFDNMVLVEKAIATYTLQEALNRAKAKASRLSLQLLRTPSHPKSFVKALEEASQETDPVLHEMWANLLGSQFVEGFCHPHFVETLPHFSPLEARLLVSLCEVDDVGKHGGAYIAFDIDRFTRWVAYAADPSPKEWTFSCTLLHEFGFAGLLVLRGAMEDEPPILYRKRSGSEFLGAVTD